MNNAETKQGKIIVFTAPSGAGKTTIVRHLLKTMPELAFSVSATTRAARDYEKDGLHYYFLTPTSFENKIVANEFIEYEEVYKGTYYGTLKSELNRLWQEDKHVLFDIDVKGAISIKKEYKELALTIFVMPPSIEELAKRLKKRSTDDAQSLQKRINKFEEEMKFSDSFDAIILNDDLDVALVEAKELVTTFIHA